jgi:transposase
MSGNRVDMAHYCSTNTKEHALRLLDEGFLPHEIAERFNVGVSTFYRWKRRDELGLPLNSERINPREAYKKEHCRVSLKAIIAENPDLYLREIKLKLKDMTGLDVSITSLFRWLKELKITPKKNRFS